MKLRRWTEKETDFLKKNYKRLTHKEIGERLGRTVGAVRYKCHALGLKKQARVVVNKKPTPDLAYVLGTCLGDGCVSKIKNPPQHVVRLGVMDREFAVSFREALENVGLRPAEIRQGKCGRWLVRATSVDFYRWYHSLSRDDLRSILASEGAKLEFIRGFYESEGTFQRRGRSWFIEMYNCNRELAEFVEELINALGFKTNIYKQAYQVRGATRTLYILYLSGGSREVIRFLREVNPCIPRKSLKSVDFSEWYSLMYPEKIWNRREVAFMRKNYPQKNIPVKRISKILGRSRGSVYNKAYQMGLKRHTTSGG